MSFFLHAVCLLVWKLFGEPEREMKVGECAPARFMRLHGLSLPQSFGLCSGTSERV